MTRQMVMVGFLQAQNCTNLPSSWRHPESRDDSMSAGYYQEIAPKRAMDRAEIVSLSETMETPAGKFTNVLKTMETTPLEPGEKEAKYYAAGVGLLMDGPMKLVRHGSAKK